MALTARVTGFERTSHTTYTTEVSADGASWTVAIRYSVYRDFYVKLSEVEKEFVFDFPKKGGFFSSPSPQERQPQLDAFVKRVMAHYARKNQPAALYKLMDDLFELTAHKLAKVAVKEEVKKTEEIKAETKAEVEAAAAADAQPEPEQETATANEEVVKEPEQPEVTKEAEAVELAQTNQEEQTVVTETKVEAVVEAVVDTLVETKVEEAKVEVQEDKAETKVEVAPEAVVVSEPATTESGVVAVTAKPAAKAKAAPKSKSLEEVVAAAFTSEDEIPVPQQLQKPRKKKLSEAQKRLRNVRRREKRKRKMKIKGAHSQGNDGMVTESEDEF
ncbi:TPA: hypothetical protein N0F65_002226 [Lagenidium giganteum]|uniref:PX domain-containing protein n=1 Tax=Lagenidium giganteum TaxID=4803 RepID=A0AAV2YSE1_9STRA|nr:TPA: hypothetical protein N0F65_002226 [Lagenidium giganteum]